MGGFSGWQIGKAKGASGWGMLGYIAGGAAIGAFTAGIGDAVTASFGMAASSGSTFASVGVFAASGATSGGIAAASFAALSGGSAYDIGKASLIGGFFGGTGGAVSGYIKYATYSDVLKRSLHNYIRNKENWLAQVTDPAATTYFGGTFKGVTITRPWWQGLGFTLARGLTSALTLPFILEGEVNKKYKPNNYTVMYRNMSSEEYSSFMRKGQNFGFGKGMFLSKQFWMSPKALQMWDGSNMTTGPYNVAISVPTNVIGPNVQFNYNH